MRMYAVFEKNERLRHIGHLDILRTMQRALRRSGLPVAYSKGFNPHMLLGFASALSVGATGDNELMEMELTTDTMPVAENVFLEKLNQSLPPDLRVKRVGVLPDQTGSLMSRVAAAYWHIVFLQTPDLFLDTARELLAGDEILAIRKTKSGEKEVNIRPSIYEYQLMPEGMDVMLSQEEGTTCKPSMLLSAIGKKAGTETPRSRVERICLMTRNAEGMLMRLEESL